MCFHNSISFEHIYVFQMPGMQMGYGQPGMQPMMVILYCFTAIKFLLLTIN